MQTLKTINEVKAETEIEAYITKTYGPPPVNPFKALRKLNALSISELANRVGVGTTAIKKAESGCFKTAPPSLLWYWTVKKPRSSEGQLNMDYNDFKYQSRLRHHMYFGNPVFVGHEELIYNNMHPLANLRTARLNPIPQPERTYSGNLAPVGRHKMSLDLCVPPESLDSFEKSWRTIQSPPRELITALIDCGYSQLTLSSFINTYEQWRRRMLNERPLKSQSIKH